MQEEFVYSFLQRRDRFLQKSLTHQLHRFFCVKGFAFYF